MGFQSYLESSRQVAETEKKILDQLAEKEVLTPIEIRAAKSSFQTLIENCIGKAKRILKHYNCPTVPRTGRDAVIFLYEMGLIDEELYRQLYGAIGFRNAMIHDYLNFKESVLLELLHQKSYLRLYDFLLWEPRFTDIQRKRIENYLL
ncbi:HepT-like ribonuclease domain-containing protein [Hydrogenimonas sp. SS33]|uniref:type VII toxin-antitoxin system HepT family RNase toxin n=1 Tax=Hydrogenimonas leucolamina TaxID=2954236 RepID=UPI00336C1256